MTDICFKSNDRLVLFGYGLFETLKVTAQGVEVPYLHWQRMKDGAKILDLEVPIYGPWYEQIKNFLCQQTLDFPFALRVTMSGGASSQQASPQLFFNTREIPYTPSQYEQGVSICLLSTPRSEYSILTRIKSTNYIENLLAKEEALKRGEFEGLWCNTQGYLVEGTMSSLFFIKDGVLHLPSLACGCLPGTRRAIVLELAASLQIPFKAGMYLPAELFEAEEVFLTNSLMGIMPVRKIEDSTFKVAPLDSDSITCRLSRAYEVFVNK
ncbi:MAG: aminotransferase class IV [Desulfitobacteriaceae bacterium]